MESFLWSKATSTESTGIFPLTSIRAGSDSTRENVDSIRYHLLFFRKIKGKNKVVNEPIISTEKKRGVEGISLISFKVVSNLISLSPGD